MPEIRSASSAKVRINLRTTISDCRMSSFDSSTHKLAGSSSEVGGLVLKSSKQPPITSCPENKDKLTDSVFKKPTTSLLGLDRLARKKREEREAEVAGKFSEKKARLYSKDINESDQFDSDVRISFGKSSRSFDDRKYRSSLIETPSHTGGVNEEVLQRIHSRLAGQDQRTHGVYASTTKDGDKKMSRNRR